MSMKTKRTPRIAIVLSTILLLNLSSCSPSSKTADTEKDKPTLTIYVDSESEQLINRALVDYEITEEPEVNWNLIDLTELSTEKFEEKLKTELNSGKGPDIVLINRATCTDPYALMKSGVFADLTPMIANDETYRLSHYLEAGLEVGKLGEKQLLVPLNYDIPILLSSQGILEESEFDLQSCKNLMGFFNQSTNYVEKNRNTSQALFDRKKELQKCIRLYSGVDFIDYENNCVTADTAEFKQLCEAYQKLFTADMAAKEHKTGHFEGYHSLKNGDAVFSTSHEDRTVYF